MSTTQAWFTACLLLLFFLMALGAAELLSEALSPLSDALNGQEMMGHHEPIIGEPWCVRADGGPCP